MNCANYAKKIGERKLILIGLVGCLISLVAINVSGAVTNALNGKQATTTLTMGKVNGTVKNGHENITWILSGSWKSNLFTNLKFNHTDPAKFSAKINMLMANGSFPHTHKLSHFALKNVSRQDHSVSYEGFLSVSMNLGPVFAIPVKITNYQNHTISILLEEPGDLTLDQNNVINHFGRKPISGIFVK